MPPDNVEMVDDPDLVFRAFQHAPGVALVLRREGDGLVVVVSSPLAGEISGSGDLTGRSADEVFPGSHAPGWLEQLKATAPGTGDVTNLRVNGVDYGQRWSDDDIRTMWSVSWHRLDEDHWVVFGADLTVQYRYAELLEDALKGKNRAFETIGSVVHELRQPIGAIRGFAALAKEVAPPDEDLAEFLGTIDEQAETLDRLVEDLLTAGLTSSGRLRVDTASIPGDQLKASLIKVAESFLGRHVVVTGDLVAVSVIADGRRLVQVVRGLIQNAVKYGGPTIEVRLAVTDSHAVIDVADDGSGLDPGDVEAVFEPFSTGQAGTSVASTGIGLGVARSLISDMGGLLEYVPAFSGAVFRVTLPVFGAGSAARPVDFESEEKGLVNELTSYRTEAARRRLNRLAFEQPPSRLVDDLIKPAMYEVGELWKRGDVSVAQEHHASSVVQSWLMSSLARYQPHRNEVVVCASAPGNEHENGLASVALSLAEAGFNVVYIGRTAPVDALVRAVEDNAADILLLSLTTIRDLEGLRNTTLALAAHIEAGLVVGYGGRLFADGYPSGDLPGVFLGYRTSDVVAALDGIRQPA